MGNHCGLDTALTKCTATVQGYSAQEAQSMAWD